MRPETFMERSDHQVDDTGGAVDLQDVRLNGPSEGIVGPHILSFSVLPNV